jgi:hypothetical protein
LQTVEASYGSGNERLFGPELGVFAPFRPNVFPDPDTVGVQPASE